MTTNIRAQGNTFHAIGNTIIAFYCIPLIAIVISGTLSERWYVEMFKFGKSEGQQSPSGVPFFGNC